MRLVAKDRKIPMQQVTPHDQKSSDLRPNLKHKKETHVGGYCQHSALCVLLLAVVSLENNIIIIYYY